VSFVASSALHKLNQFVHAFIWELQSQEGFKLVGDVIVLIVSPICILTGFVAVGSLPSKFLRATVRLPLATLVTMEYL
jgi:hypothetical protein